MKRSVDVTMTAAIFFLPGATLLLLIGYLLLGVILGPRDPKLVVVVYYAIPFVVAAVAVGIGLLGLRPWARVSTLTISMLMIVGCIFETLWVFSSESRTPFILLGSTFAERLSRAVISGGVAKAIIFVIALWWIIVFTRKRVALQFASHPDQTRPAK